MKPTSEAIQTRYAARRFSAQELPEELIVELLELANRAPSGYNLQPWHFVLVRDTHMRQLLSHIALDQSQIIEAPATVVFVANPHAWKDHYPSILERSLATAAITEDYANLCSKMVRQFFNLGPLGLGGFFKRISLPLRRLRTPTPDLISTPEGATSYVRAQVMLAAATFLIAASGRGLASNPIEGFDESRLKKLLAIPRYMSVPLVVALGYPHEHDVQPTSYRQPLSEKLSIEIFSELWPGNGTS